MKRIVPLLLLTSLLAACGSVGDVLTKTGQILMDPSIPIGPPDEHPSQVGLSLYAAPDVNPNPASMPDDDEAATSAATASNREAGPYEVRLKSDDRQDLIESLRGLLEELEDGRPSLHPLRRVDTGPSTILRDPAEPEPAPPAEDAIVMRDLMLKLGVSTDYLPGRQFGSGPQVIEQGYSGVPLPVGGGLAAPSPQGALATSAQEGASVGPGSGLALGLGQYSRAHSLPPAEPAPPPRGAATPIAFKVLQLKDDSLLLNVDPEQLAKDLKKALGSTYITEDDYVLQPGQFKFIDFARIDKATRYVAIVADFHDQNGAVWKQAFRLEPNGRRYALLMTLHGNRVAIVDESYRPPQPRSQP